MHVRCSVYILCIRGCLYGLIQCILFCSAFSCIRIEYEEVLRISLYSVRKRENTDQNTLSVKISSVKSGKIFEKCRHF